MKSLFVQLGIVTSMALVLMGCGVDVVTIEISEQGQAGGMSLQFPGMSNFGGSLSKALSDKDVDPSDVDSMITKNVTMSLLSQGGLTNDLTFLKNLSFTLSAKDMVQTKLANKDSFTQGDRKTELDVVENLEMKPYLDAGDVLIDMDATMAFPPPDVVDLEVVFKLRVDVNVI